MEGFSAPKPLPPSEYLTSKIRNASPRFSSRVERVIVLTDIAPVRLVKQGKFHASLQKMDAEGYPSHPE